MTPTALQGGSPRSSLLARRPLHEDDEKLLQVIASLPTAPSGGRHAIAGICNRNGQVYRRVELFSALELFVLIARLNALGFVQESGMRAGKHAYDVVFRKLPKRRDPDETGT
ncbi:MAG TPA: hypothetical protein VFM98_15055 [Ramlibacter sp.]|uniref:hypothetical protein n=1 Tax=Ramlibacter sp. TaxID=1917967 RepID=UPI002D7F4B38|nr:hypothetical protein [Ramlibacter sp.]HET8746923.1 hypothetical protein [Ramlibacter sp.]